MRNRKKKIETYECLHCKETFEGQPKAAILSWPMLEFCTIEHLELYEQERKGNK